MPNIFTNCLSGLHLTILSFLAYKNPLGFPYAKELSAKRPRKNFHRFLFMHVETLSGSSKNHKTNALFMQMHQSPMSHASMGLWAVIRIIYNSYFSTVFSTTNSAAFCTARSCASCFFCSSPINSFTLSNSI